MSNPPEHDRDPPYDQAKEPDYDWIEAFGRAVIVGFMVALVMLSIAALIVSCGISEPVPGGGAPGSRRGTPAALAVRSASKDAAVAAAPGEP